jgi:hypothetical protein
VHPGVDETQARRPLRRPPPAVRHRRAHRRSPHASCTPQSQINQASKAREREIQVRV